MRVHSIGLKSKNEVFEDSEAAEEWLKEPARGPGEAPPLNYAKMPTCPQIGIAFHLLIQPKESAPIGS